MQLSLFFSLSFSLTLANDCLGQRSEISRKRGVVSGLWRFDYLNRHVLSIIRAREMREEGLIGICRRPNSLCRPPRCVDLLLSTVVSAEDRGSRRIFIVVLQQSTVTIMDRRVASRVHGKRGSCVGIWLTREFHVLPT